MKISSFIIAMLLFVGVSLGMTGFMSDLAGTYGKAYTDLSYTNKTMQDVRKLMTDIQGNITSENFDLSDYIGLIFLSPYYAVRALAVTGELGTSLIADVTTMKSTTEAGIIMPWYVAPLLTTILLVVIVLGLVAIFMKYEV